MLKKPTRLLLVLWFLAVAVAAGFYSCSDNTQQPPHRDAFLDGVTSN